MVEMYIVVGIIIWVHNLIKFQQMIFLDHNKCITICDTAMKCLVLNISRILWQLFYVALMKLFLSDVFVCLVTYVLFTKTNNSGTKSNTIESGQISSDKCHVYLVFM